MRPAARHLPALATAVACTAVLAWVQFSFVGLFDGDSYFHSRAAQQLAEHGVRTEFPQAAFSTWKEAYSDKDFLFHLLSIPFCAGEGDLVAGGKRAVVFFGALFFGTLALATAALGLRFGPLWMLLATSHLLVVHYLIELRPHILALSLFPLELVLLLTRRPLALGGVTAAHVWAHSSFVLVPGLPLAQGVAERLHGRPFPWGSLASVLGGIAVATLLHPYFPHNVSVAWDQLVEVARNVWVEDPEIPHAWFGGELAGMAPVRLLAAFPVWLPAVAGLAASAAARSRPSPQSLTLAAVAAGFLALTLLSKRFLPFFAVVSALAAGSLWTERAGGGSWRNLGRARATRWWAAALLLVLCLGVGQARVSIHEIPARVARARSPEVYRPAIDFLSRVAAPEERVYHDSWEPFAWLYHHRPEGRYVVGLDPVFLHRFDARLFRRMRAAREGTGDVHAIIAGDFGARWVFVDGTPRTRRLRARLAADPRFRRRYGDRYAEIWEVVER